MQVQRYIVSKWWLKWAYCLEMLRPYSHNNPFSWCSFPIQHNSPALSHAISQHQWPHFFFQTCLLCDQDHTFSQNVDWLVRLNVVEFLCTYAMNSLTICTFIVSWKLCKYSSRIDWISSFAAWKPIKLHLKITTPLPPRIQWVTYIFAMVYSTLS